VWQIEEAEGEAVSDEFLRHLSPARFEHINRYGRYRFASRNRVPKRPFPFQYDKKAVPYVVQRRWLTTTSNASGGLKPFRHPNFPASRYMVR